MQRKGLLFGAKGKSLKSVAQVSSCNHLGPVWPTLLATPALSPS